VHWQFPCLAKGRFYDARVTNSVEGAAAAPFSPPHSRWLCCLLNGASFTLALAVSCVVLARLLPFPEVPLVKDKIEYLARHGDEFDVLFVGSSRVHCQIMPSVFDRVAGENGVVVKSFNAGINAMHPPEDGYVLEEVLRQPHRRLRWVLIELSALGTGLVGADTARFEYWHDAVRLGLIARRLRAEAVAAGANDPATSFPTRLAAWRASGWQFWQHLRHAVRRAVNIGRGAEGLPGWLNVSNHEYVPAKALGAQHDGWLVMDRANRMMTGKELEEYKAACADRLQRPAIKDPGDAVSQDALERLIDLVVRSGATPLLFVPPAPSARRFYPAPERERKLTILDYSDVRRYADLYEPGHRIDVDHLNTEGAELLSKDLALRFVELVKQGAQIPGGK
jgi:hypothetical protein